MTFLFGEEQLWEVVTKKFLRRTIIYGKARHIRLNQLIKQWMFGAILNRVRESEGWSNLRLGYLTYQPSSKLTTLIPWSKDFETQMFGAILNKGIGFFQDTCFSLVFKNVILEIILFFKINIILIIFGTFFTIYFGVGICWHLNHMWRIEIIPRDQLHKGTLQMNA
jgi:hypothetical protein